MRTLRLRLESWRNSWIKALHTFLLSLLVIAAGIGLIDFYSAVFSYLPYAWVAVPLGLWIIVRWFTVRQPVAVVPALAAIGWLVWLPNIEWTTLKQFNRACDSMVAVGASRSEIDEVMARFFKISEDNNRQTFHPDRQHSADHCVVWYENDFVTSVHRYPD